MLVVIIRVITIKLKYPDAVGEARMLQPPHDGAFSGVETLRVGVFLQLPSGFRIYLPSRKPDHELSIIRDRDGELTSPGGPATHSAASDGRRPS
ncbi:hypothetical protein CP556_24145 [Natrinema sp. CBA1119]|nr:hypothetical protein CP556_24145 [Natrinema sp. CBA1119]